MSTSPPAATVTVLADDDHREDDYSLDSGYMAARWRMEDRHFWHAARGRWIVRALRHYGMRSGASFLEVGCGSGSVARSISPAGFAYTGVDTGEPLVRKAAERVPGARFVAGDVSRLTPELQGPYDACGWFDVLEHLDRPADLVHATVRWVRPGGLVFATVPALQRLFSVVDTIKGHKRRYEPGELPDLLESCGLEPLGEHGLFRWTLALIERRRAAELCGPEDEHPPEVLERARSRDLTVPFGPVNLALDWLSRVECGLGFARSRGRVGGSLLAVARVPD